MKILAIDTSGPFAGAALFENGAITHEITACHGLTHSQTIMPMVDDILASASLLPADVDLFAAVTGPGSFTGVRIGVCAVKALAHGCEKPVIGVNALETLAMGAWGFAGVICPILDARRGQVYCAAFRCPADAAVPERVLEDAALPLSEFLSQLPENEKLLFLGDGLKVHFPVIQKTLGERAVAAPAHMAHLRASAACTLAYARREEATHYLSLSPTYLRAPQAERERSERMSKEAQNG